MANDSTKVIVGKPLVSGGILAAPVGSTLPTNATTALDAAFKAVGYVTEDGVTKTETRDSDKVIAWGGDTIALIQKSYGVDVKFAMAEYLGEVPQQLLYGDDNVAFVEGVGDAPSTIAVEATSAPPPRRSWVFEMKNGDNKVRLVFPDAQITDTGDTVYKDDDVAALDVTVSAFPDSNGVYFYMYGQIGPNDPTP